MCSYPKVAIIILNWNGREDTLECLASVFNIDYPNYEVIVVDNGSSDDSVPAIRQAFPQAHLIETGENLGYAGGNNKGIAKALENGADYIFLLNNDTVVEQNILTNFIQAVSKYPDAGVYGAKILYYDEPDKIWFAGARWNDDKVAFEHIGAGDKDGPAYARYVTCDYITGCALFTKADVFLKIGFLHEPFFLTYEETDWCYRARARGYQCILVPDARVWHKVSASFGGEESPLTRYFMMRNELLWACYHLPAATRKKLYIKLMKYFRKKTIPRFYLSNDPEIPYLKKVLWGLTTWGRQLRINVSDPAAIIERRAIIDHCLRRYGDCSENIRLLAKTAHSRSQTLTKSA